MHTKSETLTKAVLIKRINRFVAEVLIDNRKLDVYVPNTGRLSELALPGCDVLLSPINAKYKYKILYIISNSYPVMIDSTYSNRLFYTLLSRGKVPGIGEFESITREPPYGNHRFDFFFKTKSEEFYIELKSCTLFYGTTASFPDAVSTRASEHVKALAETGKGKLVFFVLKNDMDKFIPNYHTDFTFYDTLRENCNRIDVHAFAVRYDENLKIESLTEIPVIIPDIKPAGMYLLILFNPEDTIIENGESLKQGFYIYCGCTDKNVFNIIKTIKAKKSPEKSYSGKGYSKMKIISDIPLITSSITIDELKHLLIKNSGTPAVFNSENLNRYNNLIYSGTNPADESWFWNMVLGLRFGEY